MLKSMGLGEAYKEDSPTEFNLPNPLKAGRTRLVVVNESILSTHLLPARGDVVLGRGPEADVFVPHPSVSRRHAIIRTDRDRVTIEDLGSSNGTSINNLPIEPRTPIAVTPVDGIRIGKVVLILQRDWDAAPKAAADSTVTMKAPAADFEVGGQSFVVRAESMQKILELAGRVARTSMSVLILGETGTGKEMFARAIHERSTRREGPFLGLNCAALTEPLLESELFGHEKGAFTDARASKIGLFEKAAGGTVFLDEIGDMTPAIQAKLLRVFEERNVLRLGSLEARPIDVRFVTATNKDLATEVAGGKFRKDFLFRLSGVTLHVPPLRERQVEIGPLAALFADRAAREAGRSPPPLTADAVAKLEAHDWPGNIRELKNVVERAVIMSEGGEIEARHIEVMASEPEAPEPEHHARAARPRTSTLQGELDAIERMRIVEALEKAGGNQTRAAKILGIPRRTFVRKLDQFGIGRPRKG